MTLRFFFVGMVVIVVCIGCKKKETLQKDSETQTLIDNALIEQEFMSILPGVVQSLSYLNGNSANLPANNSCDSIFLISGDTSDFNPNPLFLYTLSGTDCSRFIPDGKIRSGSVSIRLTGNMSSPGSQMIIKLNNYQADGIDYFCDSTVLSIMEADPAHLTMDAKISNGRCSTYVYEIKYSCSKVLSLYRQGTASNGLTISYSHGKASGVNRFGINYFSSSDASDPLQMTNNCRYFQKGFQEITNEGAIPLIINYGENQCDDVATYYIYENTVEFKLK